jgi:hypothetical protein
MVILTATEQAPVYGRRVTEAVRAVLVEMGQILASYRGKFVVVGGSVPWLLIPGDGMPHVGTTDVDVALDAEALGDGQYVKLVDALMSNGYRQRSTLRRFQLVRQVHSPEAAEAVEIIVDFLMPREAELVRNHPPLIPGFAVQRASGAELALSYPQFIEIDGRMPDGCMNRVELAVASMPAFLAMKGFALQLRRKQKDAYDIYYCVRNYPGGAEQLAAACVPLLSIPAVAEAYRYIAGKFERIDGYGPMSVCLFAEALSILDERTVGEWQRDAFGQVNAWLDALRVRR